MVKTHGLSGSDFPNKTKPLTVWIVWWFGFFGSPQMAGDGRANGPKREIPQLATARSPFSISGESPLAF